jgi:cytochrome P450
MSDLVLDPYDPALHEDPYPVYRRLRDEAPVYRNPDLDFWALSRWDDVAAALQRPRLFCSSEGIAVGIRGVPRTPMLIMLDPPRHTRMRALVSRAFTPRRIAALEPRIRAIATALIDGFRARKEADLVADFAAPLPTIVIAELLGVPPEDQAMFKEKSNAMASFRPEHLLRPDGRLAMAPMVELGTYLARVYEERRREPRDDLMSALLAAELDGRFLTTEERVGFAILLLVAGNETTTNLISNAAVLLARHPEQRERLIEEPARIPAAVEEFLRFDSPVQGLARTLTDAVEIHGRRLAAGDQVLLLFASANRDPRRVRDPDRFDVTRDPNPHLAFGFGAHFCLGASLARLEARVAFETLLARIPGYRLAAPRVERLRSGPIRGVVRLPIAFDA